MKRLQAVLAPPLLGALPLIHLLAGCDFGGGYFNRGDAPLTSAVFCDFEADRRCATPDDVAMGIDQSKPFETGFWVNKSSPIGLDSSPAALAACGGQPQAVVYVDAFPNGTPVCVNPDTVPARYATTDAACKSYCATKAWRDREGNTFNCDNVAWRSHGVPPATPMFGACTAAGTLLAGPDPRSRRHSSAVTWTSAVGVTVLGPDLTKTAGMGWGSADPAFAAGAVSTQRLQAGDGAVQVVARETDTLRLFGLGLGDSCASFEDIEYGLLMTQAGTLLVVESGNVRGTVVGNYAAGDVLEVGVEAGVVVYKKNAVMLFSSSTPPVYPLGVEAALNFTGASITHAFVDFL